MSKTTPNHCFIHQVNKMIINRNDESNDCLTGDFIKNEISVKTCDLSNDDQKWDFTYKNITALNSWESIYGYEQLVYGTKKKTEKMLPLEQGPLCS